jgi:hypothetical protein
MWGGPGNDEMCDACETIVTKDEFIMEGIAVTPTQAPVQFHVGCLCAACGKSVVSDRGRVEVREGEKVFHLDCDRLYKRRAMPPALHEPERTETGFYGSRPPFETGRASEAKSLAGAPARAQERTALTVARPRRGSPPR